MINFLFGKDKGKSRDEVIAEAAEVDENPDEDKKEEGIDTGNPKLDMEITKIKGQLDALNEVRKAHTERFSNLNERIGEMRGSMTDLSKTISKIEVGATKAIDLVDSVQPEKLMVQVRKQDAKIEAVKAHLESTEARMKNMMDEVKKIREQMDVYKGLEQVSKMNEEMKDELSEMRKMQVNIEKHADRVETMFMEVNKKFVEFDKFNDKVKDMKRSFDKMTNDMEKFKVKLEGKADKQEMVNLINRFSDFQKHTDNVLKLLDERSKNLKDELRDEFLKIKKVMEKRYEIDFDSASDKIDEIEENKPSMMDKVKDKVKGGDKEDEPEGDEAEGSEKESPADEGSSEGEKDNPVPEEYEKEVEADKKSDDHKIAEKSLDGGESPPEAPGEADKPEPDKPEKAEDDSGEKKPEE